MADAMPQQDHELRSTSRNHKQPRSGGADDQEISRQITEPAPLGEDVTRKRSYRARAGPKDVDSSAPTRTGSPDSANLEKGSPSIALNNLPTASSITNAQQPNAAESNGPSPYGTRSRNRTGNARPNYAEDRDAEMDYEWTSGKKATGSAAASQTQTIEGDKITTGPGRRATNGIANHKSTPSPATISKEQIPGTSSFSLNAETGAQSKKRKAPGNGGTPSATAVQPPAPTTGRKATQPIPASSCATRETSMVSFESSQGYLNHGSLVADDKTRFKVNGMYK